jgi:hypothetical protein
MSRVPAVAAPETLFPTWWRPVDGATGQALLRTSKHVLYFNDNISLVSHFL